MRLDQGGHLTHGSPVSITGKLYRFVHYGVTPAAADGSGERIDFDQVRGLGTAGAAATPSSPGRPPTRAPSIAAPFREIADEVGR